MRRRPILQLAGGGLALGGSIFRRKLREPHIAAFARLREAVVSLSSSLFHPVILAEGVDPERRSHNLFDNTPIPR